MPCKQDVSNKTLGHHWKRHLLNNNVDFSDKEKHFVVNLLCFPSYPLITQKSEFSIDNFGNCEEQFPLTDCRSTVGRQITDTLPTGHRQSTNRLLTVSQNRNFTVKLSSKHRSKPDTESNESRKTLYFIILRYLRKKNFFYTNFNL